MAKRRRFVDVVHDCRKRPRLWPILHAWGKIMQVGSRKYSWRSDDLAGSGWTIIIVTYDRFNGVPAAHLRWQWARSKPVAAIGWFGGRGRNHSPVRSIFHADGRASHSVAEMTRRSALHRSEPRRRSVPARRHRGGEGQTAELGALLQRIGFGLNS